MELNKKVIGLGLVGLAVSGVAGAVVHELFDDDNQAQIEDLSGQIEVQDNLILALNESVIAAENVEPIVVNNTIEVEVPVVDEVMLKLACDKLLFDDLAECKEEIEAEDVALAMCFEEIDKEFADEDFLEDLEDDGIVEDKDEVRVVKVYDDFEDITISDSDFDDSEYEFVIKVKVDDEEADVKKYLNVTVEVEDGEVEITDVVVA